MVRPRCAALLFAALFCSAGCSFLFDPAPPGGRDGGTADDAGATDGTTKALDAAPERKTIFVSSVTYSGNLGGLAGADAKCEERASEAGLSGAFRAWLSDSTEAAEDRMAQSDLPYALVTGEVVAEGWAQLTSGSLARPIDRTEMSTTPELDDICLLNKGYVWTNTLATGKAAEVGDCDDWSAEDGDGAGVGSWQEMDSSWSDDPCGPVACITRLPIYCVQQ